MKCCFIRFSTLFISFFLGMTSGVNAQLYKDPKASVDTRVKDLMDRMTLDEKIAQMNMRALKDIKFDDKDRPTDSSMLAVFGMDGIGFLESPFIHVKDVAKAGYVADKFHRENTRLGIPPIQIAECLHGQLALGATIYPQAIAQGCTWNPDLIKRMASAIAEEASAGGVDMALSPLFDLIRDPRFGRVEECYSEDPYLVGQMGSAFVIGMQGAPSQSREFILHNKLMCTGKHFAGYSVPVAGINLGPSSIGEREMRDSHLPPFETVVKDANIYAVMPSYNEVDGVPAHANSWLLQTVLRDEWEFDGFVFSDYCGIMMLKDFHCTAASQEEAALQSLLAGVDVEAPFPWGYNKLKEMIEDGTINEEAIDKAVERILRAKFKAGLFEKPYIDVSEIDKRIHKPEYIELAKEIAEESIVLLKNEDNLLPLNVNEIKSIAVIGPNANQVQFGDYSPTKSNKYGVTVLEGIKNYTGGKVTINYAKGCDITGRNTNGFKEAVDAAQASDVVILVMGGTSTPLSGIGWGADEQPDPATCGEGFDRHELDFPGVQPELMRELYKTGKPVILVMIHGRPYTIQWEKEHIPAILDAWYPGEQGGTAITNILFGKTNPSGRLSMTIPQSVGHVPVFYNHKPSGRGYYHDPGSIEKPGHDYVFSSTSPLYDFGYGLSYTTFSYDSLQISKDKYQIGESINILVHVKNTGAREGKEVVQLYVRDKVSSTTTPLKALKRFKKILLDKGKSTTISFSLDMKDLSLWNQQMEYVLETGEFEIMIGKSANDIVLSKTIEIIE